MSQNTSRNKRDYHSYEEKTHMLECCLLLWSHLVLFLVDIVFGLCRVHISIKLQTVCLWMDKTPFLQLVWWAPSFGWQLSCLFKWTGWTKQAITPEIILIKTILANVNKLRKNKKTFQRKFLENMKKKASHCHRINPDRLIMIKTWNISLLSPIQTIYFDKTTVSLHVMPLN